MFLFIFFIFIFVCFISSGALSVLVSYHVLCIFSIVVYFLFSILYYLNKVVVFGQYQFWFIFFLSYFYWYFYILFVIFVGLLTITTQYYIFIFKVFFRLNFFCLDIKNTIYDVFFFFSGFINYLSKPRLFLEHFKLLFTQFNDRRKYIIKKYVYTINHKRIAINYLIFSM